MTSDKVGIALSVGCLVHCVLMPLVLPLIPLIGLTIKHGFVFHIVMALIIAVIAYFAFNVGYLKHGNPIPRIIGSVGVIFLFTGGILEFLHIGSIAFITTLLGSVSLITAHYKNHKYSCSCEHHHV